VTGQARPLGEAEGQGVRTN